jgi:hypothetical protein
MKTKLAIAPPMNTYVLMERGKETARMNLPIMLNRGDTFKLKGKQYKIDAVVMSKTQAEFQCSLASMFFSMECQK